MANVRQLKPAEFPPPLREIPEPPEALYIEGNLPAPEFVYLTVVGSRRVSAYGAEACEKLISELAGYPVCIVSGLAIGIDTIAHKAALDAQLPTIAWPGSGLGRDVIHPPSNKRLADAIVEAGGALMSEFPPDYPAGLHTFPRRNRLMAGLAKAVLIIEAGEKSGTLITARLATDYNRDLLVVPGSIFAPGSVGTNGLLRQGAAPATTGRDILLALGFDLASEDEQRKLPLEELAPSEREIVNLLMTEPLERDEIIRRIGRPTSETSALLMGLEIKGVIKETLGEVRLN